MTQTKRIRWSLPLLKLVKEMVDVKVEMEVEGEEKVAAVVVESLVPVVRRTWAKISL